MARNTGELLLPNLTLHAAACSAPTPPHPQACVPAQYPVSTCTPRSLTPSVPRTDPQTLNLVITQSVRVSGCLASGHRCAHSHTHAPSFSCFSCSHSSYCSARPRVTKAPSAGQSPVSGCEEAWLPRRSVRRAGLPRTYSALGLLAGLLLLLVLSTPTPTPAPQAAVVGGYFLPSGAGAGDHGVGQQGWQRGPALPGYQQVL